MTTATLENLQAALGLIDQTEHDLLGQHATTLTLQANALANFLRLVGDTPAARAATELFDLADAGTRGTAALTASGSNQLRTLVRAEIDALRPFGSPLWASDEVAAWEPEGTEYRALRDHRLGNVAWRLPLTSLGTRIEKPEFPTVHSSLAVHAVVQAVLWRTDGTEQRRERAVDVLEIFAPVLSWQQDSAEQWRLADVWTLGNLCRAASLAEYRTEEFERFVRLSYDRADWSSNPNLHGAAADARTSAAAYIGTDELKADATRYLSERCAQAIHHPEHDGGPFVSPIHYEDIETRPGGGDSVMPARLHAAPGRPHIGRTQLHWGRERAGGKGAQVDGQFRLVMAPVVAGASAERSRTLGYVNFALHGFTNAARTVRAWGGEIEPHVHDRLLDGWDYHAGRVLAFAKTGKIPAPVPVEQPASVSDDATRFIGYHGANALFGDATPGPVLVMMGLREVTALSAAGDLHMTVPRFGIAS